MLIIPLNEAVLTALLLLQRQKAPDKFDFVGFILSFIVLMITISMCSQYIILMFNIATRFENLNLCIKKFSLNELNVSAAHRKLSKCVKIYNTIYGNPMMMTFAIFLVWHTFCASSLLLMPEKNITMDILIISNIIIALSTLSFIILNAERTKIAQQICIQLLYKNLSKFDIENADKIFRHIMQIRHTICGFSCKFFEFNWQLIFKFVSACIMYLIIIVQLEGSIDFGHNHTHNITN